MIVGACVNAAFAFTQPEIYKTFGGMAILPFYSRLWSQIVFPHIQIWVAGVALFELTCGVVMTLQGKKARFALLASGLFMFGLIPFWWGGAALMNLLLGMGMFWIASTDLEQTVFHSVGH